MLKEQIAVLLLSLPFQVALLPLNNRYMLFTPGELRFWSVAILVAIELIFLAVW